MIRAVLDTNVFVSGFNFGGVPSEILDAVLERRFQLVASLRNRLEIEGVLKAKFGWEDAKLTDLDRRFWNLTDFVAVSRSVNVCRDPEDNHQLETCAAAGAHVLVSGDKDLLVLSEFEGTAIVTPRQFLTEIKGLG